MSKPESERPLHLLETLIEDAKMASVPASPKAIDVLYRYRVPKLSPDGSCAAFDVLDEAPYDLAAALGGVSPDKTLSLLVLRELIERVATETQTDWVGVYQARSRGAERFLVKLGYVGLPSRAEFPLTEAFAEKSNNTAVALSGQGRILNDVHAHIERGGAYYECDPKVRSEACIPWRTASGVGGIIDAEHSVVDWFDTERMEWLEALAQVLPLVMPEGGLSLT